MVSRRNFLAAPLVLGTCWSLPGGLPQVQAADGTPTAGIEEEAVLDGEAPVDADAIAELARDRVQLAANWLAGAQRPTGVFYYIYNPVQDEYETTEYNEVRHAGTTYALFQAYGLLGDDTVLAVAEKASDWIRQSTAPV